MEASPMDEHRAKMDIAQLVAEHHRGVFGYAFRLTGSVHDAEDLCQQVFLTAQRKLGQLRNADSVRTWLFAILRGCFWKSCRKRRPVLAGSVALNMDTIPDQLSLDTEIDREHLQQVLNQLPDRYRLVLAMFYFEGLSYREIAEQLDLPMGTVMSRLARAKSQLRGMLFDANRPMATAHQQRAASQRK